MIKRFINYVLDGWRLDNPTWGNVLVMFVTMFFASSVLSFSLIAFFLIVY